MKKLTNLIALLLLFGQSRWMLATERNPFEPPLAASAHLLWQLKGTVLTNSQKFAFLSHPKLGNYTLRKRESLPQSNWWILEITSGAILLQQQHRSQTVCLDLTEHKPK